jgi:hypothetical protein
LNDAGTIAYGVENNEDSVSECKKKGLRVSKGYIDNKYYKISEGPFNAFFILNFFEHLPDPNSVLTALHNNLDDDGWGFIEVPNFDMMREEGLVSEFINDHLFYYSSDTLTTLLERNGFSVCSCEYTWHNYILSVIVKKRKKINTDKFNFIKNSLSDNINSYINRYGYREVAVYGAGHQALAVLSLSVDDIDKIKYVVDDAPFKQGKYTPATHIPIVSKNQLESDPPKAIIVMAASYSDEVVSKLKGSNFDIAVLRGDKIIQLENIIGKKRV